MSLDLLLEMLDVLLRRDACVRSAGDEYQDPPLEVAAYYPKSVRLHWLPWVGRGLSLTAVVRRLAPCPFDPDACTGLIRQVDSAARRRFPAWRYGPALGLTLMEVTDQPIEPGDDSVLQKVLERPVRTRSVPLGLFRLNLEQEAMAFALRNVAGDEFAQPKVVAEALSERFRRYVSLLNEIPAP